MKRTKRPKRKEKFELNLITMLSYFNNLEIYSTEYSN